MLKTSTVGNWGEDVRSDCLVKINLKTRGGINLNLESRVAKLYGSQIKSLTDDIMHFFDVKHADILIKDNGALDFVIAARIETAIKLITGDKREYLLADTVKYSMHNDRARYRFTRLYIPGNSPKLMLNAGIHKADGIILDLEDSVAPTRKNEARVLVRNALRTLNFYDSERMVRINQLPLGLDDLDIIVPQNPDVILIPKTENPGQVQKVADRIEKLNKKKKIWLIPIIESAIGIENAFQIASSSSGIVAVVIGLEDYTADIGVNRTKSGEESIYARLRIVNACKAAGIQPLDSVYPDVADEEGLVESAIRSRSLGFEGMGCIHPRQIRPVRNCFMPGPEEIDQACRIVLAYETAESKGLGVVSLGSKMIDRPVVNRALATIKLAEKSDMLIKSWRDKYEKE
jgi:citrate lyase subunit beta/citryl-CoA lyase